MYTPPIHKFHTIAVGGTNEVHTCVYVCVCVYIYIYTHTHTHIHTHFPYTIAVGGKNEVTCDAGDILRIHTPGGGGYGADHL